MHLEYIAVGVPISNQSAGTPALLAWRAAVEAEARRNWNTVPLTGNLKVVIINFHTGDKPSLDLDNMSKPILDVMQAIVYDDDRQIRQAEFTHAELNGLYKVAGASEKILTAMPLNQPFVYIRIEDPVIPFPLPK